MKVQMTKSRGGVLFPANDEAVDQMSRVENGDHEISITLKQNGRLHRKIWGFFAFCTRHYYGDDDAARDEYQLDYVRRKLTVIAGYYRQVWSRDGVTFELIPLSLKYEKMAPEDRGLFYKKITDAALKRVFDKTTDQNVINQLMSWF